jgi:hypothetical protein
MLPYVHIWVGVIQLPTERLVVWARSKRDFDAGAPYGGEVIAEQPVTFFYGQDHLIQLLQRGRVDPETVLDGSIFHFVRR